MICMLLVVFVGLAVTAQEKGTRLTLGGYGEAVMTRNFYSDKYMRYTDAANYKDAEGHGRADLPHVVFYVGYDFGNGWSMSSEIEFEHGGTESAMEIEEEEGGEYESEVERGGEVALEQFWIQKSWSRAANLRMGHIIVPVGGTNQHHMPTEFFTVYRPEGENTIMPCKYNSIEVVFYQGLKEAKRALKLQKGSNVVLTGGQINGEPGNTNTIKVEIVK